MLAATTEEGRCLISLALTSATEVLFLLRMIPLTGQRLPSAIRLQHHASPPRDLVRPPPPALVRTHLYKSPAVVQQICLCLPAAPARGRSACPNPVLMSLWLAPATCANDASFQWP